MASKGWFEILEVCRAITSKSPSFTASDLAQAAQIEDVPPRPKPDGSGMTEGSKKEQIASAWLSKFVKWKYTVVSGKKEGLRRPANTYSLTELGKTCVLREGKAAAELGAQAPSDPSSPERVKLAALTDLVYDFAAKRGTPAEEAAFQALLLLSEEIQSEFL
jgi:hypothetical protein